MAFLLDGYGNRRHYLQILALEEAGFEPLVLTFKDPKEGYLFHKEVAERYVIIFPFKRKSVKRHFSLRFAFYLLNFIKNKEIRAVLTHRYKLLRYLWFCKLFYPKLRIIFHAVIADSVKGLHQIFFFKLFRGLTDKILVNSLALKEEFVRKGLAKEEEIEILYSGIDLKEFEVEIEKGEARRIFGFPEEDFLFGMLAQFRKEKDQKGLIKAFKILKEKGYGCKLVLAGDGPYIEEARALVRELNLKEEVIFPGRIKEKDVPLFLKALDAYVYATFKEGMPLAVLEAMASGLPIVATDAEGIPDIFQSEKKFGYLVPKGNIEELANAMERLLNLSKEERSLMGKLARERIKEAFSAEHLKEKTLQIFKKLLQD